MFERISDFLQGGATLEVNKQGQPTSKDLMVATVALMLNMGHSDSSFGDDEFKSIMSSLNVQFDLSDDEAGHIVDIAEILRKDKAKTGHIMSIIREGFSVEQRELVLSMLWKVVLADGVVEDFEVKYASEVRAQLDLSLESSIRARKNAEKK
ncbi:MAG: TerB family tellurite resistance protein [Bdellovibrionales bacterium]|nr:TerB family tellurite resistance protein [Bdellovibrionales bacterium]